jgi:DNA-binding NtrC family response regulator
MNEGDDVSDPALRNTTILLMVADPVVRNVMEETLDRAGYTVVSAPDLGKAVDRLKEVTPDLMITRTYLQSMSGHDAAMYLRTKSPKMRVLLVGGLMDDDRLHYREALQGFEIFPKPYSRDELLQKVADVLKKPRG